MRLDPIPRRRRLAAAVLAAALALGGCSADAGDEALDPTDTAAVEDDGGAEGGGTTGGATSTGTTPAGGDVVSGFDVATHGFSFENYGDESGAVNLLPGDVARMFGPQACAVGSGESCVLTPPGRAWMEQVNEMMAGGHCEGMAVLSMLMQQGKVDPNLFGGPTAASLQLTGNEKLQREIAFWFVTQALDPTAESSLKGAPSTIVERLRAWFAGTGTAGGYTLGFYQPDGSGGHAVTPIGLDDVGPDRVDILVYDNNHPGEVRRIEVDTAADTWRYRGSTNPDEAEDEYEGDADTASIELTPLAVRLEPQAAPFLDGEGGDTDADRAARGSAGAGVAGRTEVYLDTGAFRNGVTLTVQAPGGGPLAGVGRWTPRGADLWNVDAPPVLRIPAGQPFELVLDASRATGEVDTDIAIIGAGFDAGVDGIVLGAGQRDVVFFDPATRTLRYTTTADESPTVTISHVTDAADYDVSLGGVELGAAGGVLEARLDTASGRLLARSTGTGTAVVLFELDRYDADGVDGFENDGVELAPNETLVVEYDRWTGDATTVPVGVDANGDGVVDERFELADEA